MSPLATMAWRWPLALLGIAALAVVSCWWIGFSPSSLFSLTTLRAIGDLASASWPPDLDPALLRRVQKAAMETLALSLAGTAVAVVLGLAMACVIADPARAAWRQADAGRGRVLLSWAMRLVANALRTTPYLVIALLAVYVCGLGPAAGVVALGLHTGGILARLYAIALDGTPAASSHALAAVGARPWQILLFSALPAARPQLVAFTLYRWEVNVREAAVLGLVGCGGLGFEVARALGQFDRQALTTVVAATVLIALAVDAASAWLRRRLV
ncbi:MAG TPA: phosphonate ABC transporter, permease protein PhnE [Planctomycetes bacterium]|nr:phosphonate ABC transporter, permease protein PhnE [Planctomycetota bacterium]